MRAASNPSEIKKYELTEEDAKKIKAGVIGSEGNKLDSLLLNGPKLSPEAYTDDDYLKDKEELYIYEKGGKKYVGYNSHPMLEDTDGDGIIDSKEKPDEKLKWNVSERDMIMFMELSYRDDNYIDRVLDHKRPLTESELYKKNGDSRPRYEYMMMNKELGPYWERKKSYHTSSGLDAVLYETKSDFLYLPNGTAQVLAFRGTSDAKDIGADIKLGTGSNPQQGIDAENIMRELAKDKSITNLYLTGHSLGGYLVQRAMVEAYQLAYSDSRVMSSKEQRAYRNFYNNVLKKGTTFNAPKVVTNFFSSNEFWQKGLDSKKIAKSGKMTHYIVDNDSTIRKGVSNDSDVVINVGRTSGGHSSRSYFEADMINRRSEFISGKRISLDGTGYQDKKMTTVKSVEKVGETSVYSKRGDDVIKSTTVSIKDPDTGQITKNTLDEVFKRNGAKSTVVVTPLEPSVRYEKDAARAKGEVKITVAGIPGTRTVTTTYTVNSTDGSPIPHEEPAVVVPSKPTVVKVPAKDEVEYLKDGDNVVKKTTTYSVNASTGSLTPTETTEIFKRNGAKSKVVVMRIEPNVRYEKDATRAKGEANVTTAGTPGTRTVTTTYTVNPTDGSLIPHEGQPVIKPSTPTVVKVPAKDEVEYLKEGDDVVKKTTSYEVNASTGVLTPTVRKEITSPNGAKSTVAVTPLEPSVRYEKDATRAKGESKITVAGIPGTRTVTTTYTVNPADGNLIPREEPAVVVPSKPTVVKVPAKDEVAYLKEGDNVVKKTTSYEVNASTGVLTPTVRKEITSPNGAKSTVVVTPLESSVRYEKDATRAKGEVKITETGTPGTSTVTTTYTVNSTDGSLIPHAGQPVIKSSTSTVVKVPAKDEVEYLKEGDDVVKKTTTYEVNASTGALTPTEKKEIFKQNGAKSTVAVTPLEPSVRYEKDATRAKGEAKITVAGIPGTSTVTTTYTVNSTNGSLIPHEEPAVVVPATPTVVKVPAKDEIEYLKEGDDVVKKTITYAVNASTGALTPTVRKEITSPNGAKSTVVVTPLEPSVRYEKDAARAKGEVKITVAGIPGTRTVTTTYTVNSTDGSPIPHEEPAVVVPSKPTVVKVPAKDEVEYLKEGDDVIKKTTSYEVNASTGALTPTVRKEITSPNGAKSTVVVTPLESSVRYEKDATRAKGESKITVAGIPGTRTVTTTYTVNSTDGSLIPYEGQPVIKSSTSTVVKVPAKDEIEYLKEGDDVVKKTTSYEVNASTGVLTPTVRKEITSPNGTKATVVVTPLQPSVRYEKDATRVKGEANVAMAGTPGTRTVTTTYTVNPADGSLVPHEEPAVVVPSKPTVVKVPAKDEIEYLKEGDDVVKKTTAYSVNASTGSLTPTETTEIFKKDGAKSKVVTKIIPVTTRYETDKTKNVGTNTVTNNGSEGKIVTATSTLVNSTNGTVTDGIPVVIRTEMVSKIVKVGAKDKVVETLIEPEVEYVKDVEKDFGTPDQRTEGEKGKTVTTTTYDVDPNDGHITEHVGNPVVTPAGKTIVKVGAKTKVEQSKDSEGRDVIDTTTYEVDPKTGKVTPTTVRTYGTIKEPTVEKRVVPSPVVYEKDNTKEKDTASTTVKGEDGEDTITTIYTVDPNTGKITASEGQPVRTKEPTNTVVKVPAKGKVVETLIEPEVEYIKDVEKDFGTPDERTEGEKGKTVTTTTYDVDPNDGHITEHVGNPVVTPAGKTVVKVGAKTKVEQSKDPEGRDVIDTTSYEVDPKTGKVTPTTVRTYGTIKEPTIETRPVPSPVIYEKDDTKEKGTAPTTVKGEDGEDTITTIYTVDPNTGKITASEGQPVRTKEPTNTIVKVAAKDKVETTEILSPKKYVKDDTRDKGQDNVEESGQAGSRTTTTTYEVNPADGTITERVGEAVVVNPTETIVKVPAKDKVVETLIEPEVEYIKDVEKDFGTPDQRTEGEKGKTVTTTTYDVDPNDGHITEHVGNPVVTPVGKTIVKVGAKTKVEQSKDSEGRDVIDTTSYEVDPKTGKVTPTTVRTYGTSKEPTVEKRVVPSPVVYEKDNTKEKDTASTTVKGEDGEDSITTTYTVEPNTGKITVTEGQPVRTKEPTNTVVKVPAKDKVVEILIEPEVEYVKDVEKDFGTPDQRTEGKKGKTVTTTTYDVDPNDGHITEHVGNPVVTPAGKTIVKVGAKTKVEQSKDSEGRDVIDTTSYEVDLKTGKVTPTTVRTYGTSKETKIELEQSPKTGDVTVTPKKPDDLTYPSGTKVEIPGEDGKGKVPNSDLPEGKLSGTSKITEPDKSAVEVPNVTTPAKVIIFENGVLADSIELPELMIEVLWIDEDGNVLKPSVKTGNEKDAEHGSILGYEFVRTVIDENAPVMTHIFRKVGSNTNTIPVAPVTLDTPVTSATNGGSGQGIPAPTTPKAVNSNVDQVDTHTTIDNGAKSNDSQNVLPNTGTESNATLASLGLLGMLGGLGLALGKKKED
ncbi:LPXTG-motif cell wall anchor domain protein [Streptococcus mitis]|uniref:LPXTG-motif cell wall anchor domain protein n=1 Tax=Streptococcus mitis TaxID=28037 RepID=A0A081PZI6_STRMT|nr:LPXTG-motif cell wall anchor domain protein [Streptococcus mitis]